jgi:hypothetical protein
MRVNPSGLRHGSAAASLLSLRVRIPLGHVCFSCVLSGRGPSDGPITIPGLSYRGEFVCV